MSFDNINDVNVTRSNLFRMILFTVLACAVLVFSIFFPFIGILGIALISIPVIRLMLERRVWESIVCAIIGSMILGFISWTFFIFLAVLLAGTAAIYLFCFKNNKSPFQVIVYNSIFFAGLAIISLAIFSIISRQNMISTFMAGYRDIVNKLPDDPFIKQYMQLVAIDEVQFRSLFDQSKNMLMMLPYVIPSVAVIYIFTGSLINYFWCRIIFKKSGLELKSMPLFKSWDAPWYMVSGLIIGLILVVIPHFNQVYDTLFDAVGINLLVIFGLMYTVLGFSVLWSIFDRMHTTVLWRTIIILILSFFVILIVAIPVMGIIDVWANFRKLERR